MARIIDYPTLKTAILDWLIRPDLASVVDAWVQLAEDAFNSVLRTRWQETIIPSFVISGEFTSVPADHLQTREIKFNTDPPSVPMFIGLTDFDTAPLPSTPTLITLRGNQYQVKAIPTAPIIATVTYWARIPALGVNQTNWLLQRYPSAYLYTCVTEGCRYLKDDDGAARWYPLAQSALERVISDDQAAKYIGPLVSTTGYWPDDGAAMTT